jgi:catechol 2,3-dioxygenase-like lactoylglutathione lyase family enzyme
MLRSVDHIELVVRALKDSVAFYGALGFSLTRQTDHHGVSVEMKLPGPGGLVLEMHEPSMEENIGINHVAYLVDDIEAAVARLVECGARLERGPVTAKHTGRRLANFRDPDGWRLQIVQRAPGEEPSPGTGSDGAAEVAATRLDHIDFQTRGLEATVAFYRQLGLEVRRELEHGGAPTVELELSDRPAITLEFKQVGELRVIGINHIGFAVADLTAAHAALSSSGYRFDYPPKLNQATGRRICTARDPDGWRVQLTQA